MTAPKLLKGIAGKEQVKLFQGEVGCNKKNKKNKLKSEIFNEKKGL